MNDITRQPWSEWLENSLRTVVDIEPVCLCVDTIAGGTEDRWRY